MEQPSDPTTCTHDKWDTTGPENPTLQQWNHYVVHKTHTQTLCEFIISVKGDGGNWASIKILKPCQDSELKVKEADVSIGSPGDQVVTQAHQECNGAALMYSAPWREGTEGSR